MTAEDVIIGIFYYMKKEQKDKFTADREKLHRAFHLAQKDYPEALSIFCFRERELFPESVELDQALSNLDATGLISRQNLTPRFYCFDDSLDSNYNDFSKDILDSAGIREIDLKKAATYLSKELM